MTEGSRAPLAGVVPLPADFRAFHQLYRPAYVRWAELFLGARAEAEDVVDDLFERLAADWSEILRLDSPAQHAWAILRARTREAALARGRRPVLTDTAAFETEALRNAVDPVGELEESLCLYRAIQELPERQHDVIVLVYCLGYGVQETADVLGISVPGVRSTARYARRRLKETLGLEREGDSGDLAQLAD
ncbi:sigma-70 family RNA polymerase sigma factor [Streptomyces sp. NPDC059853]|uniref:sigma-70 family RNA polymerase sigma factor n=1 Tax=Streptomyces sp. NPDC059853 TaxID=3346973 RepID=UPI00364EDB6D